MKKLLFLITTALIILSFNSKAQETQKKKAHWRETGSGWIGFNKPDTTSKTFSLDGKDSLSYKIQSGPARCDLWKD